MKIPLEIYQARGVTFTDKHIDFGKNGYIDHANGSIYAGHDKVVFAGLDGSTLELDKNDMDLIQLAINFYSQGYAGFTLKEYLEKLGLI